MSMRKDVVAGRFDCPYPPEGLAGPLGGRPWLGLTVAERQERAFLEAGVPLESTLPEDKTRLLVREDVVLTRDAVVALLEAAGGADASWVPAGRAGVFHRQVALGDAGPWLVALAPGGPVTPERIAAAAPVEVPLKERMLTFPLSEAHHGVAAVELPISDRLVLPTHHWLQLLWANLLGLGPFLWRGLVGRNIIQVACRVGWAVLRALSVNPRRVGAKLGRKGTGCQIHPSAVVEGCWLGDDVEVGAGAVVRGCVLADGAAVEDLAMVEFSVLAPGARVQRQAMVKFSVLGVNCAAGGLMQLGTLDRNSALKRTGVLMDMALGQGVQIVLNGARVPAPLGLAGVCVGAGSVVGAGVHVAPGRAIPPDLKVVAGPHSTLARIPEGAGGTMVIRDGTLEPL